MEIEWQFSEGSGGLPPAPAAARPVGGTQKIKGMVFRETSQRKKTVMSPSKVPDRITRLALKLVTPLRYKRLSPDFMYKRRPKAQQRPEQSQKGMASVERKRDSSQTVTKKLGNWLHG